MPINVFGNSSSSYDSVNKIDTILFVQELFLGSNYLESNTEEQIDLKNQIRIKNLPDSRSIREAASKNYFDNLFIYPSTLKNTPLMLISMTKNLDNVRSIRINSFATLEEHLTPKYFVDNAISDGVGESSLLRLDSDEKIKLDEKIQ